MPRPYQNNKQIALSYSDSHGQCYFLVKDIAGIDIEPNGQANVYTIIDDVSKSYPPDNLFDVLKQFYHLI